MIASRPWVLKTVLAASLALASVPAHAQRVYSATLSGLNENPVNGSPGTGFALFTLSADQLSLTMNITFSGLQGTTSASHIHCCVVPPANGPVATTVPTFIGFPLGVTSGTYLTTLDLTSSISFNPAFLNDAVNLGNISTARATLINGLNSGTSYLNIHTSIYPSGEIRGFITTVPEPGSVVLLASGLIALGVAARRKTRRE